MHEDRPDAGGGDAAEQVPGATPRRELARSRAQAERTEAALEARIMAAALSVAGEVGYRRASATAVLNRYGGYRAQFYGLFNSFEQCYAAAYSAHADALAERLLAAGAAAADWRGGLRAALEELGRYAIEEPALARGVLVEVHVAGGPALDRREEVLERLSNALDSARRETESRHSPPPLTARFMVSGIDAAVASALEGRKPRAFLKSLPELERLILNAYFGPGAGDEA